MNAHIDFETYSEQSLKTVGTFRYVEDPTTEPLIMAYSVGDRKVIGVDLTDDWELVIRCLSPLFDYIDRGGTVVAHNAAFERGIWENTELCRRFPIRPKPWQWDCTAARARMLAIPGSLEGAADALGVPVNKDPAGKALMRKFSNPQIKRSKGVIKSFMRIRPHDDPEAFEAFIRYCEQDVEVERAIDKILPPLSDTEKQAFILDYEINKRGMPVNMELVDRAFDFVEEHSERIMKRAVEISGCRPTQREKTMAFLESRGLKVPNLQAATVERLAKKKGVPDDIVELLDLRIELSRAGTKKLKAIRDTVSPDNRIRGGFLFSAASTRRWSSTGVQMHNLQKPEGETNPEVLLRLLGVDPEGVYDVFDRPLTSIAQSIRGFFEAQTETFHIADYSSVEPRGLAWIADEQWILDAYSQKKDLYKITAGKVYGLNPDTISKDGPERFMGKQLVLGCGYGMGPPRFVETVAKFGRVITEEESREAVYGYRNSVQQITKFWRTIEKACIKATREWKTYRVGKLQFRPETLSNGFRVLFVDMPSGSIAYPVPSIGKEWWNGEERSVFEFYTPLGANWVQTGTFGGSLTENVVQALCRDILRDGMLAADKAGFYLVGHVHDEAIAEGDDNPDDLKEFQYLLSNSSPWAKGFPIETEAFNAKRYRK